MKIILVFFALCLSVLSAHAQTSCYIKYTYDAAGNRIHREYVCETDNTPDEPETSTGGSTTTSSGSSSYRAAIQDTVISGRYTLVYPNPNKGEFWVEFHEVNSDQTPIRKIYVLDIDGKIILELSTSDLKNKIELTHVTAGSYFVVIYDGQKMESHQITVMK